ncbi:MAG: methylmalonyl-CoA mutase family protein, partial [Candidatus Binatia bacterium]|nr:methylmalonyl-CoA mutase family protein [Candidatus Binatia bacterium]
AGRDPKSVENALNAIRKAAEGDQNLMPHLIKAVDLGCSVGEISDIYRDVFGEYRDPGHL